MQGKIRVALVGCGRIARVHRSYLQLPGVELVGVFDQDPAARHRFADEAGAFAFDSVANLLEGGRPDVVHVLTPPRTHAPLAIELLEAGVNVLVEKPLAWNTAEAERVLETTRRTGRWVTVDHNRWFDPVVQNAAGRLEAGHLGELVGVDVFQGAEAGESGPPPGDWRGELPGGLLHNLVSHPLYLVRRFAGPIRDLHTVAQVKYAQLEEVRLVARGERCPVSVTLSTRTRPFTNRLTLYGSAATAEVNLNNMTLVERRPKELPKVFGKVWPNVHESAQLLASTVTNGIAFVTGKQRYYPGIGAHLRQLYANLAAGQPPPVSAEEGRDVVAWYDEILAQCGIEVVGRAQDSPV